MIFRLASDIHTEFFDEDQQTMDTLAEIALPPLPADSETTLLLAGDIGSMQKPDNIAMFLRALAPRFQQILYIPGNHEYYFGDFTTSEGQMHRMLAGAMRVSFAEQFRDEVLCVNATTLWTDFDKENPLSMDIAHRRMNDYRLIRNGDRPLWPSDTLQRHKEHVEWLKKGIGTGDLVMTHHSPSLRSIPAEYLTERVNGAYHSDLEWLIEEKKPAVWVHGHTHTACDYMIGGTRVICNPRGYGNQFKKNGYNATLTFEI